jgi:ABC-type transport system involved in multi-copper enzyme maturation permease subunit
MAGGTFALVERSLRVDSRSLRTHIVRLLFAIGLFAVLVFIQTENRRMSNPGGVFFGGICIVNVLLLNLAGMSFFSTIITEEKEEMTLGLLKMAGISSIGILLGKLAPRLITVLMLLSIQLPFTFLSITLGGISTEQVLAAYASLISFSILLAGVGMLLSTVCSRSTLSTALMTGLLLAFYLMPVFGRQMARASSANFLVRAFNRICEELIYLSPFESMGRMLSTGYSGGVLTTQFVVHLMVGGGSILLSWMLFDRCTRNEKPIAPSRGMAGIDLRFKRGKLRRRRDVWGNALAWKDYYFTTGGHVALVIKFICYASLMLFLTVTVVGHIDNTAAIGAMYWVSMLTALAIEVPVYFSRVFREEIRWQTWPGLVLLPESITTIAKNKLIGILPTFTPGLSIMCFGIFLNGKDFFEFLKFTFTEIGGYYALSQYLLLVLLSLFLSLTVKWGALPLAIAIVALFNVLFAFCAANSRGSEAIMLAPTFIAGVAYCVLIGLILDRLRQAASQ